MKKPLKISEIILGYKYLLIRLGVISKMSLSTLQYFTFALKSKANTKILHLRVLNHPLMAPKFGIRLTLYYKSKSFNKSKITLPFDYNYS